MKLKIFAGSSEAASCAIIQPAIVNSVKKTAANRYVQIGHQNFGLP